MLAFLTLTDVARAEPGCRSVKLVERPGLSAPFRDAARALRRELEGLSSEDCIAITLFLEGAGARGRLVAIGRDGVQAERDIDEASALRAIALGLIASAPPEVARPLPEDDPLKPSAAELPPPALVPPPLTPPPRAKTLQLAMALETGARLGEPTRVVVGEVEVRAHLVVRDLLVGVSVRYAPFGVRGGRIPGYAFTEIAFGPELGHRFRSGLWALDVTASPLLVITTEEGDVPADGVGGTDDDFRMSVSTRALLPFAGPWRPSVTIDAEVAPFSVSAATRVDPALPPLPTWSIGLRAGAAGDLL